MSGDSTEHQTPRWRQSIFQQLHAIGERALTGESPGHSLQPTLLVDDACVRLLAQRNIDPADRSQVLVAAANIIRRILVDCARRRKSEKRGGVDGRGIPLRVAPPDQKNALDVLELNDVLTVLSKHNPRAARIVKRKFFGGLSFTEISVHLGVSRGIVHIDWRYAKAWLYETFGPEADKGF